MTRWLWGAAILFVFAVVDLSAAVAQEAPVWTDVDCSQSQLSAPAGVKCRATQIYAGSMSQISGAGGGGQHRRWANFGIVSGSKIYAHCLEEVSVRSSAVASALEQAIRSLSPYAKRARDFSAPLSLNDASYQTFISEAGEKCVAIRKLGPARSQGYKWILEASKCAPAGRDLPRDEIGQFIAQVNFRD